MHSVTNLLAVHVDSSIANRQVGYDDIIELLLNYTGIEYVSFIHGVIDSSQNLGDFQYIMLTQQYINCCLLSYAVMAITGLWILMCTLWWIVSM